MPSNLVRAKDNDSDKKMRLFTSTILVVVVVLFKEINGEPGLNVTILTDLPLDGEICAGQSVNFSCRINSGYIATKYRWIVGNKAPVTGDRSHVIQVFRKVKVTCIVIAILNRDPSDKTVTAGDSVIALPGGGVPVVTFPYLGNYVNYPTGTTANLTATVVSTFSLTELTWSPPPYYSHPKNETNTTKAGNVTTTILSIPNIQIKNIGNYTLTTANKCGKIKSYLYMDIYTECSKIELIAPPSNFTTVENYDATATCRFKGKYSFSFDMRAELPSGQLMWMSPGSDQCGCMLKRTSGCPGGGDPNDCCLFNFVLTCVPPLNCSGALFACDADFASNHTAHMTVLPSPKMLDPPTNVSADAGTTVNFTCEFQTTTDTAIVQFHWLYNDVDIEDYKRTHNLDAKVTNVPYMDNCIVSTLTIYSIQHSNAGEYSCYCSYNKTKLDVDHSGTIKSNVMSANLNVSDKHDKKMMFYIIVGAAVVLGVIIILFLLVFGAIIIRIRRSNRRHYGYQELPVVSSDDFTIIHHRTEHHAPDDRQLPVSGPGCQMFINRNSQILPGVDSQNTEMNTFKGTLRGGLPPLTVLSPDLQAEWEELGLHMGLDLEALRHIKEGKMSQTNACCLEVFIYWLTINVQATWEDFVTVLQEDPVKWNTIASGLAQHLNNILIDSDGRPKRRKQETCIPNPLQKHYIEIVEHVDPEQLLLQLKTHDLLTPDEEYMLLNTNFSLQKRTKLLLQRFCSKNPTNSVQLFYQCLREEKQHSGHKYLADLLEQDVLDYEAKISNKTEVPKKAEKGNRSIPLSPSPEGENDDLSDVIKSCWMQVADMLSVPPNVVYQISAISQDPLEQANLFLHRYTEIEGSHAKGNIIRALDQLGIPVNRM
ncbi:uncharacterized protein [Dysidea avara]|uniref:uncharacterized protein isoform X2 n=1 Tax=Dysidea avara TaxID=196820 RepID=UPI00332C49FE